MSTGSWAHLAARFFNVLGARGLDPAEERQVRGWLHADEYHLYFGQARIDMRHGFDSARFVARVAPDRLDLIRSTLLHDIGKRHARLGPLGRSAASAWAKLGGRSTGRWAVYLNHAAVAAQELYEIGAEPVVVSFARSHHGDRPDEINEEDWNLLTEADKARW